MPRWSSRVSGMSMLDECTSFRSMVVFWIVGLSGGCPVIMGRVFRRSPVTMWSACRVRWKSGLYPMVVSLCLNSGMLLRSSATATVWIPCRLCSSLSLSSAVALPFFSSTVPVTVPVSLPFRVFRLGPMM